MTEEQTAPPVVIAVGVSGTGRVSVHIAGGSMGAATVLVVPKTARMLATMLMMAAEDSDEPRPEDVPATAPTATPGAPG